MEKLLILAKRWVIDFPVNFALSGYDLLLDALGFESDKGSATSRTERRRWQRNVDEAEFREHFGSGARRSRSQTNAVDFSRGRIVNHLAEMNRKKPESEPKSAANGAVEV